MMKHLSLPLVDAYLIVRSRRLSVLIQPNMRLLYNLLGWEVKLARERAERALQRAGVDVDVDVDMGVGVDVRGVRVGVVEADVPLGLAGGVADGHGPRGGGGGEKERGLCGGEGEKKSRRAGRRGV